MTTSAEAKARIIFAGFLLAL
ncbi:MAG: hypothetical protein JWQ76_2912, partial [Ramlibacter sp.]|nr:hypothetical protein [Ramlibacter sp.]